MAGSIGRLLAEILLGCGTLVLVQGAGLEREDEIDAELFLMEEGTREPGHLGARSFEAREDTPTKKITAALLVVIGVMAGGWFLSLLGIYYYKKYGGHAFTAGLLGKDERAFQDIAGNSTLPYKAVQLANVPGFRNCLLTGGKIKCPLETPSQLQYTAASELTQQHAKVLLEEMGNITLLDEAGR